LAIDDQADGLLNCCDDPLVTTDVEADEADEVYDCGLQPLEQRLT
jgi:hypothetical protein